MALHEVSWFVSFHAHDPSRDKKCICYAPSKGRRCRAPCNHLDNQRAIEIHRQVINDFSAKAVDIQLLEVYILCVCCKFGYHQDSIQDAGNLTTLAARWLDEIKKHAAGQSKLTISSTPSAANIPPLGATTAPTATNVSNDQGSSSKSSIIRTVLTPSQSQPHYELRPRDTSVRSKAFPKPPLSEFRTHVAEPDPTHSVSSKIQEYLYKRDFEIGSLYIFDRKSSPGHVKIGWTAWTVPGRLDSLSKCGYTPNLLFQVDCIPHAQRVETLTHHELIKEWRRERRCNKGLGCQIAHREWFEISKERAKQVLGDWAMFMTVAEPYDSNGHLKTEWVDFVQETAKSGEPITVAKLLEHYELSSAEGTTLVGKHAEPEPGLKIEKQEEGVPSAPQLKSTNERNKAEAHLHSRPTELPTPAKDSQMHNSEAWFTLVPLTPPPSGRKERRKIESVKFEPRSKSPFSFKTGLSSAHPLPELEDLCKLKPPRGGIAAEKVLPDNQSSPEQTRPSPPLPKPSPLQFANLEDKEEKETVSEHSDRPVHESLIRAKDADESKATEAEPAGGDDAWDIEDTVVEIVAPGFLRERRRSRLLRDLSRDSNRGSRGSGGAGK